MTFSGQNAGTGGRAGGGGGASLLRSAARRDQLLSLLLALALLVTAIILRPVVLERRKAIVSTAEGGEGEASIKRLAIEFPRLTLGGFRGLLATILWAQAEESKNDRQWTKLETQYDYIAVLQPYIVSVYVYHSWNQAYNLSAQWHEQENKYKWVLDGITYLYKGEDFNPGAADLQLEEANLYFLKLGGAFERIFYRKQWRADLARLHELRPKGEKEDPPKTAVLRHVYEIATRPEFRLNLLPDPEGKDPQKGYGVELTYFLKEGEEKPTLKRYYGVSPYYFSYRGFQRTLANPVAPTTTGMQVIDAWPAMSLRLWCRDDLYYTTRALASLGLQIMERPDDMSLEQAMEIIGNRPDYPRVMRELRDCFENIGIVAPKAVDLFEVHLKNAESKGWLSNKYIHRKHIKETKYYEALGKAEGGMLEAFDQWVKDKGRLTPDGLKKFGEAQKLYKDAKVPLTDWIHEMFPDPKDNDNPDKQDFVVYGVRIDQRVDGINKLVEALQSGDAKKEDVDLSFLQGETVEK